MIHEITYLWCQADAPVAPRRPYCPPVYKENENYDDRLGRLYMHIHYIIIKHFTCVNLGTKNVPIHNISFKKYYLNIGFDFFISDLFLCFKPANRI